MFFEISKSHGLVFGCDYAVIFAKNQILSAHKVERCGLVLGLMVLFYHFSANKLRVLIYRYFNQRVSNNGMDSTIFRYPNRKALTYSVCYTSYRHFSLKFFFSYHNQPKWDHNICSFARMHVEQMKISKFKMLKIEIPNRQSPKMVFHQ